MTLIKSLSLIGFYSALTISSGCSSDSSSDSDTKADVLPTKPKLMAPAMDNLELSVQESFSLAFANQGANVTQCSVNPQLPTGLSLTFIQGTCAILGSPLAETAINTYTISGENKEGATSTQITLSVKREINTTDVSPEISISGTTIFSPQQQKSFTLIFNNIGGETDNCSSTPDLPEGLSVNSLKGTCILIGAAQQTSNLTQYKVTATNDLGRSSTEFQLSVLPSILRPPELVTPANNNFSFNAGDNFSLALVNNGGAASECGISPSLPAGLDLQTIQGSCVILGTTNLASTETQYTLSAKNNTNTESTVMLSIEVNALPAQSPQLQLSETEQRLLQRSAFSLALSNTGGTIASCNINPVLPSGLRLDLIEGTCVILGTPLITLSSTDYVITAENSTGNSQQAVSLEILPEPPQAPSFAVLDSNVFQLSSKSNFFLPLSNQGGSINTCSITPALPTGLSLESRDSSCSVFGTPQIASPSTTYTITGTNISAETNIELIIETLETITYTGDGPDPDDFDHVAVIKENVDPTTVAVSLSTDINDETKLLRFQSTGFPNRISSMAMSNGEVLSESENIERFFKLYVVPETGEVEIRLKKKLNFESDPAFYELRLQLGDQTLDVLVRLFDVQYGNDSEVLKISSLSELESFFSGEFVSENIGFDYISITNNTGKAQNLADLHVTLDRDIDASSTEQSPWPGYELGGYLSGDGYVIKNMIIATRAGFIVNGDRFKTARVSNIGFVDTTLSGSIIQSSSLSSTTNSVFVSGIVDLSTDGRRVTFAPFRVAGKVSDIYSNLFYKISGNYTSSISVGGLLGGSSAPIYFSSGYSNGAMTTPDAINYDGIFAGMSSDSFVDLSNFGSMGIANSLYYSAIDFRVSNSTEINSPGRPKVLVGGIAGRYSKYPKGTNGTEELPMGSDSPSSYNWRYIKDRNDNPLMRLVANMHQDSDNDGLADDLAVGPALPDSSMSDAEAKQAATYAGRWTQDNSPFDITEGEYPALKGMPYPHVTGASWMTAEDPGIAYQRATYNDYLNE